MNVIEIWEKMNKENLVKLCATCVNDREWGLQHTVFT